MTKFGSTITLSFVLACATSAIAGCGHDAPPPVTPVTTTETTHATTKVAPASPNVAVSDDIAKICDLKVADIASEKDAPKFDFDKTDLSSEDRDTLNQIARCLTSGPLKGKSVRLVGRTDSRGEAEYNMGLGEHRADSVKSYLGQLGVGAPRIAETSRGELDAHGTDDQGWRKDRRVDVLLQ